jgi:hypothetical protein
MNTFEAAWNGFYPGVDPVGCMMREAGAHHWVRFHSLPSSQRYPNDDSEMQIVLARQNALAGDVLGAGQPCWLSKSIWLAPPEERVPIVPPGERVSKAPPGQHIPIDDDGWVLRDYGMSLAFRFGRRFKFDPLLPSVKDEPEQLYDVYVAKTAWWPGAFDRLLWAVANDSLASVLWMSAATGAVFAPYDGGVDLFLPQASRVVELKVKYAGWLPANAEGL